MYPITEEYKQKIQQPARQFAGRVLIPKLTATFTRNSIAYKSDGTQVPANTPRFEQGRFGQAIMVEEGTGNHVVYCSELWNLGINNSVNIINRRFTRLGEHTFKVEYLADIEGVGVVVITDSITWPVGQSAISAEILEYYEAPGTIGPFGLGRRGWGGPHLHGADKLGRKVHIYTDNEQRDIPLGVRTVGANNLIKAGSYMVWRFLQAEPGKPYATSFIDGTRSSETLNIPTEGVLNPQEGTVEMRLYVNPAHRDPSRVRRFFEHLPGPGNSNRITMQHNNGPFWLFSIGDANGNTHSLRIADSDVADGWRLFTMKWGVSEFAVYVDGVKKAFLLNPTYLPSAVGQNITIDRFTNSLIDDLRISQRAKTDEEILETYGRGL